ncbi:MAG: acetyl-CoA carboxylase biotin carboxyl carrier protein [Deferribacteraceae bacterium]|nr:acetyl-CoA carboxylase biotin carboxyl carrier protein [Deferribacteraceae bacterium]
MNLKDIKEFIRIFDKTNLTELDIKEGDNRLYMSRHSSKFIQPAVHAALPVTPQVTAPPPASSESDKNGNEKTIQSPMIGTYYCAPAPEAAPFVKSGDIVEKGQTLCIIEAMKIMNAIEADYRCRILKILMENGKSVEYGQDIFVVEPL